MNPITRTRPPGLIQLLLLALLLGGLAPALKGQTTSALAVQNGQKVVFMGDSITWMGWNFPGGYVHLVVAGLAAEGVNVTPMGAGVSGNTSKNMLARLERDVLDKKPNWMTLSCGVNDVWLRAVDLPTYEQNMTSIIDQAQTQGIKVLILTPTGIFENLNSPENQKLAGYVQFLHQLAQQKNCLLADLNADFHAAITASPPIPGTTLLTLDGVHPNPAGHMIMARGVLKAWGVPDADMPKVEEAWNAIPEGASLGATLDEHTVKMKVGQYEALETAAQAQHIDINALINQWYLQLLVETTQALKGGTVTDYTQLAAEARKKILAQLNAIAPPAPATPANAPTSPPASIVIHNGETLIFVGDSLHAFSWTNPGGYIHLVADGLAAEGVKVTASAAGNPGSASRDIAFGLQHLVLDKKPTWLVLNCGINDAIDKHTDLADYEKNITTIVDQAQAAGIKILILTPTEWEDGNEDMNKKITDFTAFLRQLAPEKKCLLADVNADFHAALTATPPTPGTALFTVEGVYPNSAGHLLMARSILKAWGVPDADTPKVENAWNAIPEGALVAPTLLQPSLKITLGQYKAVMTAAQAQHLNANAMANQWYLQDLVEAMPNFKSDQPDYAQLASEVQQKFAAQVAAVAPTGPAAATAP